MHQQWYFNKIWSSTDVDCSEGVTFYFDSWFITVSLSSQFLFLFMFSTIISLLYIMNAEDAHELFRKFLTHAFLNVNFIYSAKKNMSSSLYAQKTHGFNICILTNDLIINGPSTLARLISALTRNIRWSNYSSKCPIIAMTHGTCWITSKTRFAPVAMLPLFLSVSVMGTFLDEPWLLIQIFFSC